MMARVPLMLASLLLAACSGGEVDGDGGAEPLAGRAATPPASTPPASTPPASTPPASTPPASTPIATPAPAWDLLASGEGSALRFPATGDHAILLFCPAGEDRLLVNIPGFRPIGSEERLSFGSGAAAHALVADTRGDAQRGGVSGEGAVPAKLAALIGGPVAAVYGAQQSGPHPAVPVELAEAFVEGCG